MKKLFYLLSLIVLLGPLQAGAQLLSLSAVLEKHGNPLLIASDFSIKTDPKGNKTSIFYGVTKKATDLAPDAPLEGVLMFANDSRLKQYIGYHFEDIATSKHQIASTMFGSRTSGGTHIDVYILNAKQECRLVFSDKVRIVYFETGTKENPTPLEQLKRKR